MICLSFDTDRMSDERMREFLELVEVPGTATFFCTSPYPSLTQTHHELGPHVYLPEGRHWDAELKLKRDEFPHATGWRSHSCVFSHILAEKIAALGYSYVSLHDETGRPGLRPVRHAWGIWHLPIFYMDNLDFSAPRFWDDARAPFSPELIETPLAAEGLYVFAFHPIHLMLNSPSADEYFRRRDSFEAGDPIDDLTFDGYGTLDFYNDLCSAMRSEHIESISMQAALEACVEVDVAGN